MPRVDWTTADCVFIARPLCPSCGRAGYVKVRTLPAESDGSQTKLVVCRQCAAPYKIVVENPESGN